MLKVIAALVPSAGLLFLFWMALRALIQADRRERAAEAKWERAHGRLRAVEPGSGQAAPAAGGERPGTEEPGPEGTTPVS